MPGVFRPYTLVDVLGTLNSQNNQLQGAQTITGLGDFGETNETAGFVDSATGTLNAVAPAWDGTFWGQFSWG